MIIRRKDNLQPVEWGNGQSYRLLVNRDGMGFAVTHTVVTAGSESRMQYTEHVEACYCIAGRGNVRAVDDSTTHLIEPGTVYALDNNEPHLLTADPSEDLHLVSIFNPPLKGDERHTLSATGFSTYPGEAGSE